MDKEFIRSKECRSCGAVIAAYLQRCPYCQNIQPAEDLLPEPAYREVEAKLLLMEEDFKGPFFGGWNTRPDYLYYVALFRIAVIPVILSLLVFLFAGNWILSLIILIATGIVSFIQYESTYRYYRGLSFISLKKFYKKRYKKELDRLMKKYNAHPSAYQDVLLDIMENKEYGEFSPLQVIMDPIDE